MSQNGISPKRTGGTHWLEYMPGHAYCFLPSLAAYKGQPFVYNHVPEFLKDFQYYMEIGDVRNRILVSLSPTPAQTQLNSI